MWSTPMKIFALTFASLLVAGTVASVEAQSVDRLIGKNVSIAQTNYQGRDAIQVIAKPNAANATSYALLKDVSFLDGVIELDLAGQPAAVRLPARAGSSASLFVSRTMDDTSTSTSGPRTGELTIKSGGITRLNTVRTRILGTRPNLP